MAGRLADRMQAEAIAHPNIALIKYWGNRDDDLRIPANGSISLTLGGLDNRISIKFEEELGRDELIINGEQATEDMRARASQHLDLLREKSESAISAQIESTTTFPIGAGVASSAAAFAALTVAAASALGLELSLEELSRLARRGSGSAARSIHGGYVELLPGDDDASAFAQQLAPADHWEVLDLIVLVDPGVKHTTSSAGHSLATSSPLQQARVADAPRRLAICRSALETKDFGSLAYIVEQDSDMMHAIMMTSEPALHFWNSGTMEAMAMVRDLRREGVPVCYTIDAGPNVHCLCLPEGVSAIRQALSGSPWKVLEGRPGGPARVV